MNQEIFSVLNNINLGGPISFKELNATEIKTSVFKQITH